MFSGILEGSVFGCFICLISHRAKIYLIKSIISSSNIEYRMFCTLTAWNNMTYGLWYAIFHIKIPSRFAFPICELLSQYYWKISLILLTNKCLWNTLLGLPGKFLRYVTLLKCFVNSRAWSLTTIATLISINGGNPFLCYFWYQSSLKVSPVMVKALFYSRW